MIATPVFDPVSSQTITDFLGIFQNIFLWVVGTFKLLIDFMLSNPYLVIALGIITLSAAIAIFKRMVR